jgi:flagellar FliL protein
MSRYLLFIAIALLSFNSSIVYAGESDGEEAVKKAIYYQITEPFTINFLHQSNQQARYLQIKLSLMAYDQAILDEAEANLPMIQDELRMLYSSQTMEQVTTVEGRRALQASSLETVKTVLKQETGNDNIEGVFFTSFILQ